MKTLNWKTLTFAFITLVLGAAHSRAEANYTLYAFTDFAGMPGGDGNPDGIGSATRFYGPSGVAVDNAGNVYVADSRNDTIRKITPAGAVTTLAGLAQFDTSGWPIGDSPDGTGSAARPGIHESVGIRRR